MSKLALLGGQPIRKELFNPQPSINKKEINAVNKFINKENVLLSGFRGNSSKAFWGGEQVNNFETAFSEYIGVQGKSIAVNSCTSALQIACAAIGLKPGDEVIVTPWSMICSATAPMLFGAIPVFADLEKDYFCLDPESVKSKITNKTRAIIAVDLFGQPIAAEALREIAKQHGLFIIEDAAQALGAKYANVKTGLLGDIGCFSFTQGKHLTSGEGGIISTNDADLMLNCALMRNHVDAVTNDIQDIDTFKHRFNDLPMAGFNMRLTELQAVILQEQLKKIDTYVKYRQENAKFIYDNVCNDFIKPAPVRENCTHSYYCQAFLFDSEKAGIHRNKFIDALKAELQGDKQRIDRGVPISKGYITPLYKFPVFQKNYHWAIKNVDYTKEYLPVVERLQNDVLFNSLLHGLDLSGHDLLDIRDAFNKVFENLDELR